MKKYDGLRHFYDKKREPSIFLRRGFPTTGYQIDNEVIGLICKIKGLSNCIRDGANYLGTLAGFWENIRKTSWPPLL